MSKWQVPGKPQIRRYAPDEKAAAVLMVPLRAGLAMSTSFGPGLSVWLGPGWVREANPE